MSVADDERDLIDRRFTDDLQINWEGAPLIVGTTDVLLHDWTCYAEARRERVGQTAMHLNLLIDDRWTDVPRQHKYDYCLVLDVVTKTVRNRNVRVYQVLSSCGKLHNVYPGDLYFDDEMCVG